MILKETSRNELVEVLSVNDLLNPFCDELVGRFTHGEEAQDPEKFKKSSLVFQSGEVLPRCWIDPHYRDDEIKR